MKPIAFKVILKNGICFEYEYDTFEWNASKEKGFVRVADGGDRNWLVVNYDEFSRIEVVAQGEQDG